MYRGRHGALRLRYNPAMIRLSHFLCATRYQEMFWTIMRSLVDDSTRMHYLTIHLNRFAAYVTFKGAHAAQ